MGEKNLHINYSNEIFFTFETDIIASVFINEHLQCKSAL